MARPGIAPTQIEEVINQLAAEGGEVTVTAIRQRLGSGSYSTIGAVLNEWRQEQAKAARPAIPEPPESLNHLLRHLWAEAWKTADSTYEPERQGFARERQEQERVKLEMTAEIDRLEQELEQIAAERDTCRAAQAKHHQELEAIQRELAKATGAVELLQPEVERLRAEGQKNLELFTAWVERATKAETRLQEIEKAKAQAPGSPS